MLVSSRTTSRFATFVRPKAVLQVLHRMFPFARGLYEDKVANFWCSISVEARMQETAPHMQTDKWQVAIV